MNPLDLLHHPAVGYRRVTGRVVVTAAIERRPRPCWLIGVEVASAFGLPALPHRLSGLALRRCRRSAIAVLGAAGQGGLEWRVAGARVELRRALSTAEVGELDQRWLLVGE